MRAYASAEVHLHIGGGCARKRAARSILTALPVSILRNFAVERVNGLIVVRIYVWRSNRAALFSPVIVLFARKRFTTDGRQDGFKNLIVTLVGARRGEKDRAAIQQRSEKRRNREVGRRGRKEEGASTDISVSVTGRKDVGDSQVPASWSVVSLRVCQWVCGGEPNLVGCALSIKVPPHRFKEDLTFFRFSINFYMLIMHA